MTEIAIYLWLLFIAALTFGVWTFPIVIVLVIIHLFIQKRRKECDHD